VQLQDTADSTIFCAMTGGKESIQICILLLVWNGQGKETIYTCIL